MSLIDKMKNVATKLETMGYVTVLPNEDDWSSIPTDKKNDYKKEVSMKYFKEIAKEDTSAVLVINEPKKGTKNYIGANTFAEIAIAFYFGKKIYLLNDFYNQLIDELAGWGAVPLYGVLSDINN